MMLRSMSRFWLFCMLAAATFAAKGAVGFFAPGGLPKEVIENTQIGLFEAQNLGQVEQNLSRTKGTAFKAFVDLGPVITRPQPPAKLSMRYVTVSGQAAIKDFKPLSPSNLKEFVSDGEMRRALSGIMEVLSRNKSNVGAVFLADEPYTHGISKLEMERAARVVRRMLDQHGMRTVKIGVIFASGMFNRSFASLINREAGEYVRGIDQYYASYSDGLGPKGFADWVNGIKKSRLVTYDRAGNMYVGGGLPRGYDIYGFDFYLSTILLDDTHEQTLSWLAQNYPDAGCSQFADLPMSRIRAQLSFFRAGGALTAKRYKEADRRILDAIYDCRMRALTAMLIKEARGRKAQFLLVSESSDNGVLEFLPSGAVKPEQPNALIDARVLDEVDRAEAFYSSQSCVFDAGLLYFTYQDSYDSAIKLHVGGARGMPAVMSSIYGFARRTASSRARKCSATAVAMSVPSAHRDRRADVKLTVTPGGVPVCLPGHRIASSVSWAVESDGARQVKVDVLAPDSTKARLFTEGRNVGSAATGVWVVPGTRFDLIDSNNGEDLATYTVTASRCAH